MYRVISRAGYLTQYANESSNFSNALILSCKYNLSGGGSSCGKDYNMETYYYMEWM